MCEFVAKLVRPSWLARIVTLLALIGEYPQIFLAQTTPGPSPGNVVTRSIRAVSYQVGGGATQVTLKSTGLMAVGEGQAKVQAKQGVTNIEATVKDMSQPITLGAEFLTYVLWAVSPEGRTTSVGEIQIDPSGDGRLKATVPMQTFSLFLTAEPYFAVRQPSEMVVLENEWRKGAKGKMVVVDDYQLLRRAQYEKLGNPLALTLDLKNIPLELYEARNAVEIAKSRDADKYAPEIFRKAEGGLKMAETALARKSNVKEIKSTARLTVQSSEDARALAVRRQEEERIANERAAAAAKAKADAEAKAALEAQEAQAKADAEAARIKRAAQQEAQRQAELTSAREAKMRAEAETAAIKASAEADALKAREMAAKADAERARQAAEALRSQLLGQLNRILETADTARGLVVTMADVLFDTGKYDLRANTREKLAQLSGILLAHPGLTLAIEGYTDSTGSDEINQKLSEQRAGTVRDYLTQQGLPDSSVTAKGFGKAMPVADNSTAAGRRQNRRVEIVLSGEVIGVRVGK